MNMQNKVQKQMKDYRLELKQLFIKFVDSAFDEENISENLRNIFKTIINNANETVVFAPDDDTLLQYYIQTKLGLNYSVIQMGPQTNVFRILEHMHDTLVRFKTKGSKPTYTTSVLETSTTDILELLNKHKVFIDEPLPFKALYEAISDYYKVSSLVKYTALSFKERIYFLNSIDRRYI